MAREAQAPVSEETLAEFDRVRPQVEEAVLKHCLAADRPEETMGPAAEAKIKNGLGFVSKMLRTTMSLAVVEILQDQMEWGKDRLPQYGVSADMVIKNFGRYREALEKEISPAAFSEMQPYIDAMIAMQRTFAQDALAGGTEHGNTR